MRYVCIDGYYYGWVDIYISELHKGYPEFFKGMSLLITCLDSGRNVSSLNKWISSLPGNEIRHQTLGSFVWFDAASAKLLMSAHSPLTHFDEMYLFKEKPELIPGDFQWHTSDGAVFDGEIPPFFIEQFKRLGAVRFLADGCGMNFACESMEAVLGIKAAEDEVNNRLEAGKERFSQE